MKASSVAWWLVWLGAADLAITRLVLSAGGVEANPLLRGHIDTWQAIVVKIGVPLFVVWLVRGRSIPTLHAACLFLVMATYVVVTLSNVLNLKELMAL